MGSVLGVIPARYASTRFPGKALAPLGPRTLIEEVWLRAAAADRIDHLVVATDDARIADTARGFGAEVVMTSAAHASGTDRVAQVARDREPQAEIVLNIQGDEPLLTASSLDRLVAAFAQSAGLEMATLAEPIDSVESLFDPNVVKVVTDAEGRALYFSRSPIPYHRGDAPTLVANFSGSLARRAEGLAGYRRHQGIYAYRRAALLALTGLERSPLERDEGLEQLRALQAGFTIGVIDSDFRSLSVDTPEDLERVQRVMTEAR